MAKHPEHHDIPVKFSIMGIEKSQPETITWDMFKKVIVDLFKPQLDDAPTSGTLRGDGGDNSPVCCNFFMLSKLPLLTQSWSKGSNKPVPMSKDVITFLERIINACSTGGPETLSHSIFQKFFKIMQSGRGALVLDYHCEGLLAMLVHERVMSFIFSD